MSQTAWPTTLPPNTGLPRIGISIPIKGDFNPEFQDRMYIPLINQTNWCQKVILLSRAPSITVARDSLVKQALKSNCDYIFFVDSDVVMEKPTDPNLALYQLYSIISKSKTDDVHNPNYKEARIVSGGYRAKQKTGFSYAFWLKYKPGMVDEKGNKVQNPNQTEKGFIPIANWTGNWLKVDVVGLGFCLIDTMVFKQIPAPWFVWDNSDDMSEDFYFCQLAAKHGFSTYVFSDVQLSHLGNLKVKWDGTVTVQDV